MTNETAKNPANNINSILSFSEVRLMGRIGGLTVRAGNRKTLSGSIAVVEQWQDKDTDEWKNKTVWVPFVSTNPRLIEKFEKGTLNKGTFVQVEGSIYISEKTDKYPAQTNISANSIKVVALAANNTFDDQS